MTELGLIMHAESTTEDLPELPMASAVMGVPVRLVTYKEPRQLSGHDAYFLHAVRQPAASVQAALGRIEQSYYGARGWIATVMVLALRQHGVPFSHLLRCPSSRPDDAKFYADRFMQERFADSDLSPWLKRRVDAKRVGVDGATVAEVGSSLELDSRLTTALPSVTSLLLVDDVVSTSTTIVAVLSRLVEEGLPRGTRVTIAAPLSLRAIARPNSAAPGVSVQ